MEPSKILMAFLLLDMVPEIRLFTAPCRFTW